MLRASLLLAMAALAAGCLGAAAPQGEPAPGGPTPPPAGVVLADLESRACTYNDIIFQLSLDDAQALLPEGWRADAFYTPWTGALVVNFFRCQGGAFAWEGADLFLVVQPPQLPELVESFDAANRTPRSDEHLPLDLYMLAAQTDHEGLRQIFARADAALGPGRVSKSTLSVPGAEATRAEGRVEDDDGALVAYSVQAPPPGFHGVAHHRQWRQTDEGVVLVERLMSVDGADLPIQIGTATCDVSARSVFAPFLAGRACATGQDVPGGFGWTGRAYLFPGVFA